MFDTISQSVNVPKRDLLSIVATVRPGSLNGCKWCKKTILWNGGTWVHVNDRPACAGIACRGVWVKGKTAPVEVEGLFKKSTRQAPVCRCKRCDLQKPAWRIMGKWMMSLRSECPAAVATPIQGHQEPDGDE